jgi:hypothetical protein
LVTVPDLGKAGVPAVEAVEFTFVKVLGGKLKLSSTRTFPS